jgi:uncharacterized lipoprotein YddW (UPF0748 family)
MRARPLLFLLAVATAQFGCGSSTGQLDGGGVDGLTPIDAPAGPDARVIVDGAPPADSGGDAASAATVEVGHTRELRAAWVATVSRLDFPSRTGLSSAEARAEIEAIVDVAADSGFNAIFFQVRAESDAMYASTLEPWSRFLSGTQGTDPGYDPLALFLELGHARGVEIHAWMNPFRAKTSPATTAAPTHVTQRFPAAAITYNGSVVMDPSSAAVRDHVVAVVADITRRYDIDGVVFDDYFYPYPDASGTAYPDAAAYAAYTSGGGALSKSDWRRDNVNVLVAAVATAIKAEKSWVRWGIAPFGIYRPGMPAGIVGLDSYEVISCDSLRWISEGWVDYLAPQLYWTSTSTGQPFGPLIAWWAEQATEGRPIIPSLALYRLGSSPAWTTEELATQIALTRGEAPDTAGATIFRHQFLRDDLLGSRATIGAAFAAPSRPPALPGHASAIVEAPLPTLAGATVTLAHSASGTLAGYAIYRASGSAHTFERWVPAGSPSVTLDAGSYAISAIDRAGAESGGVELTVP